MARRELKAMQCMVHLEPTLYGLLQSVAAADADSASTYLRGLLVARLREMGKLSNDEFARMTGVHVAEHATR